jgi:glucose/arabinose dehydrogenase
MRSFPRLCVLGLAVVASAPAAAQTLRSSAGDIAVQTVARGLDHPWGVAFLPDGRLLVTERAGRMRIVDKDGKLSPALAGVPRVFAASQGGLLDVVLDRGYAQNHTIYFCYAERMDGGGGRTTLARARLVDEGTPRIDDVKPIFRQEGPPSSGRHFGCRIVQTADDNLFLSMGDHGDSPNEAQNLANHIGKIVRVRPDGSVPPDNPFVGRPAALASEASGQRGKSIESRAPDTRPEAGSSARAAAKPEIWSYGNRNAQGLALHPTTGKLWEHEHGPRGGDEVNIIEKGKNYGWPVIGFGIDYSGAKIHEGTQKAGMEQPVWHWVPSIAPSGMAFYTGNLFPAWRGSLLVGALAGQILVRLEVDGEKVVKEERLELRERVRDVRQGPDGALWLATDSASGRILRLAPAK